MCVFFNCSVVLSSLFPSPEKLLGGCQVQWQYLLCFESEKSGGKNGGGEERKNKTDCTPEGGNEEASDQTFFSYA